MYVTPWKWVLPLVLDYCDDDSLLSSSLLRLPAFDDSVRVRHHLAVPIPVATHLPAHCFCTAASPAGCSCAIPDGYPAQRRSSAILPPPAAWGTELNRDLMRLRFTKKHLKIFCQTGTLFQPFTDPLWAACTTVCPLPPGCWTEMMQLPFANPVLHPR